MFKQYNSFSNEQLIEQLNKVKIEYKNHLKNEAKIEKQLRKNLYWWFLLPLFGLFIYQIFLSKRKKEPINEAKLFEIKEKLIYCELEIKILETKIGEK